LRGKEPVAEQVTVDGERMLLVLKPLENSKDCQMCHGTPEDGGAYGHVRAVLAVYRSQEAVEERVRHHEMVTLAVGALSSLVFLGLLLAVTRVFGVQLPRRFGAG
ncbi:DUF3365 domain-containing protein, partial [Planctomycetota bacterium]|nr:DUF3365 domain-containing protein [Planctomycetota bacterium]